MSKKTPLFNVHEKYHGKTVDFFGFILPIQYEKGIIYEHNQVRNAVGFFDVSHMGEFFFEGEKAKETMLKLFTNNINKREDGTDRYDFMCNHQGNTLDDCLVYKYNDQKYMVVVNGANIIKDEAWVLDNIDDHFCFTNRSDEIALIAVQGPNSKALMEKACSVLPEKYYTFLDDVACFNKKVLVSKTGYTGELGYEIYCDPKDVEDIFENLYSFKEELDVTLCGLGARDTLRLEAGMPLYGHELSEDISPIDSSLSMFISDAHQDYIGAKHHQREPKTKRIGLELLTKGVPREGYIVYQDNQKIGAITSGTFSPSLNVGIAMALVDTSVDTAKEIEVEIRNKRVPAKIVSLPFNYKQGGK